MSTWHKILVKHLTKNTSLWPLVVTLSSRPVDIAVSCVVSMSNQRDFRRNDFESTHIKTASFFIAPVSYLQRSRGIVGVKFFNLLCHSFKFWHFRKTDYQIALRASLVQREKGKRRRSLLFQQYFVSWVTARSDTRQIMLVMSQTHR